MWVYVLLCEYVCGYVCSDVNICGDMDVCYDVNMYVDMWICVLRCESENEPSLCICGFV